MRWVHFTNSYTRATATLLNLSMIANFLLCASLFTLSSHWDRDWFLLVLVLAICAGYVIQVWGLFLVRQAPVSFNPSKPLLIVLAICLGLAILIGLIGASWIVVILPSIMLAIAFVPFFVFRKLESEWDTLMYEADKRRRESDALEAEELEQQRLIESLRESHELAEEFLATHIPSGAEVFHVLGVQRNGDKLTLNVQQHAPISKAGGPKSLSVWHNRKSVHSGDFIVLGDNKTVNEVLPARVYDAHLEYLEITEEQSSDD